jgi:hypothetical protein
LGNQEGFVVEVGGEVAGAIQYGEGDPMYRHASVDIFLATAHQGRGLDAEAIRHISSPPGVIVVMTNDARPV